MDDIKRVLDNFQKGYTERNLDNAKSFVNDLFSSKEDCIVVGTGFAEWCKGKDEILELIEIDWQYWGNLSLDLDNAVITMAGEAALFNVAGDLSKGLDREMLFSHCTDKVKKELMSSTSNEDKVFKSLKLMSYYLHECSVGEEVRRPLRLSGALVKEDNKWRICNLHFSYAVAPPTDIRILKGDGQ